ncbi:MAG: hypothetical protein RLZZ324_1093 [Candidatus Parcubacteria bacterium]|jgi:hypothetical protein
MNRRILMTVAALAALPCIHGCMDGRPEPTPEVDKLAAKAQQAAEESARETVTPNEIEMIEFRRNVMGRTGLQLYVTFINDMGQPVDYFVTKGKCTSSNKRLTDDTKLVEGDKGSYYGYFDVPAASEDGTNGESDEYIYCRTVDGKYKQWNGDYYASDAPIELTIKPLVLDLSGKNQQQQ